MKQTLWGFPYFLQAKCYTVDLLLLSQLRLIQLGAQLSLSTDDQTVEFPFVVFRSAAFVFASILCIVVSQRAKGTQLTLNVFFSFPSLSFPAVRSNISIWMPFFCVRQILYFVAQHCHWLKLPPPERIFCVIVYPLLTLWYVKCTKNSMEVCYSRRWQETGYTIINW